MTHDEEKFDFAKFIRYIATAPEMYARLEQVGEDFEALGLTSNRDSVLRLLAKARGEGGGK